MLRSPFGIPENREIQEKSRLNSIFLFGTQLALKKYRIASGELPITVHTTLEV
ncbi:MAG TPA: hypothetical protein VJC17_03920 [Candidatus Dojkabacteria bacterium]|nr:hypothetical protein [Candidatus Dojkabacteria bacterium]